MPFTVNLHGNDIADVMYSVVQCSVEDIGIFLRMLQIYVYYGCYMYVTLMTIIPDNFALPANHK